MYSSLYRFILMTSLHDKRTRAFIVRLFIQFIYGKQNFIAKHRTQVEKQPAYSKLHFEVSPLLTAPLNLVKPYKTLGLRFEL